MLLLAGCSGSGTIAPSGETDAAAGPTDSLLVQAEEYVNIGYGSVPKSKLTGAVSTVDPDDLGRPVATMEELLMGRVAGLIVRSRPGGGVSVMIRGQSSLMGSNEPLYVVDGTPLWPNGSNGLRDLNPADVKSIEVLKDAGSTAIYGSRGANGVILITTKRAFD